MPYRAMPCRAVPTQDLHIGTPEFFQARTKWRPGKPLTVLELRAWRLAQPLQVAPCPEFFGCFSWGEPRRVASVEPGVCGWN